MNFYEEIKKINQKIKGVVQYNISPNLIRETCYRKIDIR